MKYVKMLGLLAVAAAALMAFAGSASATTITSPTGVTYTGEIHAENENGHVKLENPIAKIECASTLVGHIERHGSGVTAGGKITTLDFTGCTNSWHVTTTLAGELEVHYVSSGVGTVTSKGAKVDTTRLGVTCVYETSDTHVGTLTDSHITKSTPTIHVSTEIPINASESSGLCGSGKAKWAGAYTVTTPMELFIDP